MKFNAFLDAASTNSNKSLFEKAAKDAVHCAWRVRRDRYSNAPTVEYAVRGNFDPVFTLLATGKWADNDIETNFSPTAMTHDALGIRKHLEGIGIGLQITKVDKPSLTGVAYKQLSLESPTLINKLSNRFKLPGKDNPVPDLRAENPTVRVQNVKDYQHSGTHTVPRLYVAAAFVILGNHGKIVQGSDPSREGVVAIVADQRGNIVSWGLKNQDVDCWHGETISVIRLGGQLPSGAVVFSSLKPCHMCSGVLYAASGGKAKVYWGMDDPRVKGKTILETEKLGSTLGANKATEHKAKALLSTPHVPNSDVAVDLLKSFNQSKEPSAINWSADQGGDASKRFKGVETSLSAKAKRYQDAQTQGKAVNTHVAMVLAYLDGFLHHQAKVT